MQFTESDAALDHVRLLLFEPHPEVGDPMTRMLRAEGFRGTEHIRGIDALKRALAREAQPHAVVADTDTCGAAVVACAVAIRRGELGCDPFMALIATQSGVTRESLKHVVAAGFDYVLDKPYSPLAVLEHIQDLARKPRRFVASSGYLGPERRTRRVETDPDTLIEAPNRLGALLAGGTVDEAAYAAAAARWRRMAAAVPPAG